MAKMIFATGSLSRRIELAECHLTMDAAAVAKRRRTDVLVAPIGGGAAVFTGPGEPFNKVIGLGFEPVEATALDSIERAFDERGAPLQVELATLADPRVADLLTRRGYYLSNFENVLGLRLSPEVVAAAERVVSDAAIQGLAVRAAAPEELSRWADAVVTGFAHPDTFDGPQTHESFPRELLTRVFGEQRDAGGYRQFLAMRDGDIAGGGSIRVERGLAQLCGAATLPAHRRRGVQSTLLRARLVEAARGGCDLAVVTTQPGSKSQENVQRAGFELLYARAVLVRQPQSR